MNIYGLESRLAGTDKWPGVRTSALRKARYWQQQLYDWERSVPAVTYSPFVDLDFIVTISVLNTQGSVHDIARFLLDCNPL